MREIRVALICAHGGEAAAAAAAAAAASPSTPRPSGPASSEAAALDDFAQALAAYERLYGDGKKRYCFVSPAEAADFRVVACAGSAHADGSRADSPRTAGPHAEGPALFLALDPRVDYAALAASPRLGWLRRPVSEAIDSLVLELRCGRGEATADAALDPARRLVARLLARIPRRRRRSSAEPDDRT